MDQTFHPKELGQKIKFVCKDGAKPIVTFLIGSGFSVSAGVPTASGVVEQIKKAGYPDLLDKLESKPDDKSDYQFVMEHLDLHDRNREIKAAIRKACDEEKQLYKVNFAHLLLALLAKNGYINRILTVNFDPLIVEALSLLRAPVRTYDVGSSGTYPSDVFDPGTVIYMHGQVHSLLIRNSDPQLEDIKGTYRGVLAEAVRDSFVVVCGYSGDCDPLIEVLSQVPNFPRRLWWSQFEGADKILDGVEDLLRKHTDDARLCCGMGADEFMWQLVIEGMGEEWPDNIKSPIDTTIAGLEAVVAFPKSDFRTNPIESAIQDLKDMRREAAVVVQLPSRLEILEASKKDDLAEFTDLANRVNPDPNNSLSQAVGDAFLAIAQKLIDDSNFLEAEANIESATKYGVPPDSEHWVWILYGDAYAKRAISEGADYSEKSNDCYRTATEVGPNSHEAFYNWGNSLLNQAIATEDIPAKLELFRQADEKFNRAVEIKTDKHEAWFNLACSKSLQNKAEEAISALQNWKQYHPRPTQQELIEDPDFDPIRETPELQDFLATLPEA